MGFVETTYLVLGMLLGVVGIAVVRWMILRPARRTLTTDLIDQLNSFSAQIRRLTDRMGELTRSLEGRRKNVLTGDDVEMGETLAEMNRLLHEVNEFFAREEMEESERRASDFTGPDEEEKFDRMERITDEEISRTDWDKLIDRLRGEHDNSSR
ncbi:MAG TPA: hypothetical protein VMX57_05080 [Planctomycetota bacterium]|nr:hypothetical protein [Planctomycetota bacterium]